MGWYCTPEEGSEFDACAEPCEHRDCAKTRKDVASPCHYCGKRIGHGARVYFLEDSLAHAVCLEQAVVHP